MNLDQYESSSVAIGTSFEDDLVYMVFKAISISEGKKIRLFGELVFREQPQGHNCVDEKYFVKMDKEIAQNIVNKLWDIGIRPSQSKGSSGQLEAVKYHLEDMRKIAIK